MGESLEEDLRRRAADLTGIVNGVDVEMWNPARDPALPARFGPEDLSGKVQCKQRVCAALGLDEARPLLAFIGRLCDQKGVDLLAAALPGIVAAGANVVFAGGGEAALRHQVEVAVARHAGRAWYAGRVEDDAARRLLAAADLVAMPSRYEPCGIVQFEAQRSGAVVVARRTGGLIDTVKDLSPSLDRGNGFLFDEATSSALGAAVERALQAMKLPGWDGLRRRVMRAPMSWSGPARHYEAVYRGARTAR
ncbi:MAG: glycosyltransferase [Myxococcales bacterium]